MVRGVRVAGQYEQKEGALHVVDPRDGSVCYVVGSSSAISRLNHAYFTSGKELDELVVALVETEERAHVRICDDRARGVPRV